MEACTSQCGLGRSATNCGQRENASESLEAQYHLREYLKDGRMDRWMVGRKNRQMQIDDRWVDSGQPEGLTDAQWMHADRQTDIGIY